MRIQLQKSKGWQAFEKIRESFPPIFWVLFVYIFTAALFPRLPGLQTPDTGTDINQVLIEHFRFSHKKSVFVCISVY
jgi:hypothetical protein